MSGEEEGGLGRGCQVLGGQWKLREIEAGLEEGEPVWLGLPGRQIMLLGEIRACTVPINFLLMHLGDSASWPKSLGPYLPCGRPGWNFWLWPGPALMVVLIYSVNL